MANIIVLGGGASGLAAAISAAQTAKKAGDSQIEITLVERMDRVGKKLLATGNGRCNLSNANLSQSSYFSTSPKEFQQFFEQVSKVDVIGFFNQLGLMSEVKEMGRIYPKCGQASMVLDILLAQLQRLHIRVRCDFEVAKVTKQNGQFTLVSKQGEKVQGQRLIVCAGGMASASLGSNGSGFALVKQLGHSIAKPYPCLVPVKIDAAVGKVLKGIRTVCQVSYLENEKIVASELGELQFADYGLSGIPIMQLSCYMGHAPLGQIKIDLFPEYTASALFDWLKQRVLLGKNEPTSQLLLGTVNKKIAQVAVGKLLKQWPKTMDQLTDSQLNTLVYQLKNWVYPVREVLPHSRAQVTGGGVYLHEVNCLTMQSKRCDGLYLCGEVLDVVGLCGGYNLHWAWASGILAGAHAAKSK